LWLLSGETKKMAVTNRAVTAARREEDGDKERYSLSAHGTNDHSLPVGSFTVCASTGEATPAANPNDALDHIAGFKNEAGNVMGLVYLYRQQRRIKFPQKN
jgi:hypothetical protein